MIIIVCLTDLDIYLVARIFVEELGVLLVLRSNIWCPLARILLSLQGGTCLCQVCAVEWFCFRYLLKQLDMCSGLFAMPRYGVCGVQLPLAYMWFSAAAGVRFLVWRSYHQSVCEDRLQ